MRVGITGANGFIGNHLTRFVISRGLRPVLFLQKGSSTHSIRDLENHYDPIWGDLLEYESLDSFIRQCDVVFHLAGYHRYWNRSTDIFRQVNYNGVKHVIRSCLRNRVKKLVHVSSCITLGVSHLPVPRNEDSEFNLQGTHFPFAETKKAGEDLVLAWVRMNGLPAVVVNPTSAIGEYDYGPTPIAKPIYELCKGRSPLYVEGGACFIDVHDVVRGLWLALEKGIVGERYLLAGDNLTHQEFLSSVAKSAKVPEPRIKLPRPVIEKAAWANEWIATHLTQKEPTFTFGMSALVGKYLYFDGKKAKNDLGFEAASTFEAIQRSTRWFQQERLKVS